MSTFKVGDTAWYRDHTGKVNEGTVYQIEGGKRGEMTEVYWPDLKQAMWFETNRLYTQKPDWGMDQLCTCGCPFGEHSPSGCISHQIHRFEPAP